MGAVGGTNPTILDQLKRLTPDGGIDVRMVEALTKRNPVLQDAVALEGNLPTGHRFTTRAGLPAVGWRRLNEGIAPSKSTTVQVDEACGILEGYSEVDVEVAKLNGNEASFRMTEDKAFLQAMNNEAATSFFYASTKANPEKIHGFTPRFNALSDSQVVNLSGSGSDTTSIWFITWSEDHCHLIYPKGSRAGWHREDKGEDLKRDSNGKILPVFVTHFQWKLGLVVKDRRYVARVANFDTGTLPSTTATTVIEAMIDAYYKLFDPTDGRTIIYCNRTVGAMLHKQALNKSNNALALSEYAGMPVTTFLGHPIRWVDAITNTETAVS
jgi:hypothetical protein